MPEIALEDSLRAVGRDHSGATSGGEKAIPESPHAIVVATRAIILDSDLIHLVLSDDVQPVASLVIDCASGVALIASLASAIARRSGRAGGV